MRVEVEIVEPRSLAELTGIDQVGERKIRRLLDLRTSRSQDEAEGPSHVG